MGFFHTAPPTGRRRKPSKNKLKAGRLLNPLVQQLKVVASSTGWPTCQVEGCIASTDIKGLGEAPGRHSWVGAIPPRPGQGLKVFFLDLLLLEQDNHCRLRKAWPLWWAQRQGLSVGKGSQCASEAPGPPPSPLLPHKPWKGQLVYPQFSGPCHPVCSGGTQWLPLKAGAVEDGDSFLALLTQRLATVMALAWPGTHVLACKELLQGLRSSTCKVN